MRRRRKALRRKAAPIVNAMPTERIKMVTDKPEWKKIHEARAIRAGMLVVIAVILVVVIVCAVVIWNMAQKADRFEWEWLNEFTGKTAESEDALPSVSEDEEETSGTPPEEADFRLLLVNETSPAEEAPALGQVEGVEVDARIAQPLTELLAGAEAAGISMTIVSGYVSIEEQNVRFAEEVDALMAQGYTRVKAETEAASLRGGVSEYHTGLTVRLSDDRTADFRESDAYTWLVQNSVSYGFVFRYPENKTRQTGVDFDPQALRYVGEEHAARMRQLEMCLEEYTDYLSAR